VIVELFLYVPKHMPARVDPFTAPPFIQFLLRDPDAFRVYGLDDVLFPDTSGVYGLADVRAIDAMYPRRYLPLIRQTLDPAPSDHFTTGARADIFRNQAVVDAMNVKYVLSIAPLDSLDFWGPAKSDPSISVEPYAIDGAMKPVLVQRPPSRVTFPVRVPDGGATLAFSVGSTPSARPDPNDDGIRYRLESVTRTGDVKPLFAKHIERRARPGNGQWHPETIDLGAYAGQRIGLTFVAEAGHAASAERGAWADLRLIGPDQDDAWRLVYDAEVKIYRNDRTLPRAFVVHAADVVASADEALARVTAPGFDPRRVVVLEERVSPALVDSARAHVAEAVQIRSYGAHRIELRARLDTPGMLVLGDTHYPGWRATVDGKPARIHRANFLFRAVALEAGDHRVEFAYRPRHFYAALLCAGLALTGVAIVIVRGPRRSRRETAA
jgi:hypothetical protein